MIECVVYAVLLFGVGQLVAFALRMDLDRGSRVALGLGLAWSMPLLGAGALHALGAFSPGRLVAWLVVAAFAAAAARALGRPGPPRSGRALPLALLLGLAAFSVWVQARDAFAYYDTSLLYLSYGSPLLQPGYEYPLLESFGHRYVYPFVQMKYALIFPTLLLSSGDPIGYHVYGVPLFSAWVTPALALGAYGFFRQHLSRSGAVLLAAFFLHGALYVKLYSVRAETLAWMPGFAFLIATEHALRRGRTGSFALAALLWVTTALTHGVVALVAGCLAAGSALLASTRDPAERARLLRGAGVATGVAGVLFLALYGSLHAQYTRGQAQDFVRVHSQAPAPGEIDPGVAFYHLYTRTPAQPEWLRVRQAPPVVPLGRNLQIMAVGPMLEPVRNAPWLVQATLILAALAAAGVLLFRRGPLGLPVPLLAGFGGVIVVLVVYSVILDYQSRAWFPWGVAPRRLEPYVSTAFACVYALLPLRWIEVQGPGWLAAPLAGALAALLLFAPARSSVTRRADSLYLAPEFLEAVSEVRERAQPGERAVANFGSMGHMAYLTGTPFVSEGVMPFELHGLMQKNLSTLFRTREIFVDPRREPIQAFARDFGVRFALLSTGPRTPGAPTFKVPDAAAPEEFEGSRVVFRNAEFVLLDFAPGASSR